MDIDFGRVEELTGINLEETDAFRDKLATLWSTETTFDGADFTLLRGAYDETIRRVMALKPVGAGVKAIAQAKAVLGPVTAAIAAWDAFVRSLWEDQSETRRANVRRLMEARNTAILGTYSVGDWWSRCRIEAPTDPVLVKAYGASVAGFVGQVSPGGLVFSAARGGGRRDVLRPSWPTSPWGQDDRFYTHGGEQALAERAPPVPPFKMAPGATNCQHEETRSCEYEDDPDFAALPGFLRRAAKWVCIPFDFSQGCSIPPSWWVYCLGAGRHWGWLGQAFAFSPAGATISAAIRTPTPLHLAIPARAIRTSLLQILERTGVLDLPEDPSQVENGVFRERGGVGLVLRGAAAQGWSPAARLRPGSLGLPIPGPALREVIDGHLWVLAIREALLRTMPAQTPELRAAARESPDPDVRASADGVAPRTYYARRDPLGLFRPNPKRQGRRPARQTDDGDRADRAARADLGRTPSWSVATKVGVGAAAAAAAAWWVRRRRRAAVG